MKSGLFTQWSSLAESIAERNQEAACIDLTPTYAGSLTGSMQPSASSWLSLVLTAYIAAHFGWIQALDFAALLTPIGAFFWVFVKADESLEEAKPSSVAPGLPSD